MSDFNRGVWGQAPAKADMSIDVGLRGFMLGVYNKLGLGLIVSAALAYVTSAYAPARDLLYVIDPVSGRLAGFTILGMVLRFAPLLIILFGMFAMRNASPRASGIFYWSIVATLGASLGIWGLVYTGTSVAITFLISAAAFGGLSLVGYTTKRDLTGMGSFLIMGVWGLVIASVVNMFLHLPGISFIISILGVLIFSGLIAYDTQRLKATYYQLGGDQSSMAVATNYGALSLYLDFINLFQFLMSLMGARR